MEVIRVVRKYRPEIVLCNAPTDRHPDHGRAAQLVSDACFLSGLVKVETADQDLAQQAWRPRAVYHYLQFKHLKPDFLVDVTGFMETKMAAIKAHRSQFYFPGSAEPETLISQKNFLNVILERAADFGRFIGVQYAEGYTTERYAGVKNLFDLL
jgi:bacillithiol biosynthesis deacetylase BshB1